MASDDEAVKLTAQCLCKAQSITTSVPTSSLPLQASYCHCTSCRHVTGGMYSSCVAWPGSPAAVRALSLRGYVFSQKLTILFCGTCSSPMFWRERHPEKEQKGKEEEETFEAFTGVLSNNAIPNMIQVKDHIFVGDTLDGGAAIWLRHLMKDKSGAPVPCYRSWRHDSEFVDPDAMAAASEAKMKHVPVPDEIPVHCRCKGVNLILHRGIADYSAKEPSQLPFFVDPSTHKLIAGFDACHSCRTSAGIDVMNWTFTLLKHIDYAPSSSSSDAPSSRSSFPSNTLDLKAAVSNPDRDPRLSHLAYYASSDDVQRYFCSRCSASVFYAIDSRPNMVDLGSGLLDAPDGARAESVLVWTLGLMIWPEDVKGGWREELVDSIKRNSEDWRIKNGIPVSWARKLREERTAKNAVEAAQG